MNSKQETIKLWAFWYNHMTEESSSYIESYHRTKKGALEAMKIHRAKEKEEWIENDEAHKVWCKEHGFKYRPIIKFGRFQSWFVGRFDLVIQS